MAFTLDTLPNGKKNLEFEVSDIPMLVDTIAELFGKPKVSQRTYISELWEFGGGKFEYSNEWSEPCLIAHRNSDNKVLQNLYEKLREGLPDQSADQV
ncbi:hypothetical protein MWU53_14440 [Aliiroseovarius sp. S1123]|uniref:hypothetical protein n=1 Tax=unclassified Aliiroseovarius TaxID=2623558 RepID=UPI001FF3D6DA|nr:hypothetical protein [Aliiroseovarius sp. S1123]MCK0172258.1 hypothetical protein [Aliiroseovarius sp. S1123]